MKKKRRQREEERLKGGNEGLALAFALRLCLACIGCLSRPHVKIKDAAREDAASDTRSTIGDEEAEGGTDETRQLFILLLLRPFCLIVKR